MTPLIELLWRNEAVYLNKTADFSLIGALLFGFLEVRRKNRVDHVELVLENAVLFLQLTDSLE